MEKQPIPNHNPNSDMRDKVRTQLGYRPMTGQEAHLYFWHDMRPLELGKTPRPTVSELKRTS